MFYQRLKRAKRTTETTVRALAGGLAVALATTLLVFAAPATSPAAAAPVLAFDPGLIITDAVFFNSKSMTEAGIQNWIESKDPDCVDVVAAGDKYTCLANFSMKTKTMAADANCSKYTGKSSESAATIIYRVSRLCGVNPQVLLVTLQKEQSLITGGPRSEAIYRKAMGYGCPDTASCNSKYYGFFNQTYRSAWQFEQYRTHPKGRTFQAGKTVSIRYSPKSGCTSSKVLVRNQATAGLYNYTPYQPNAAALAAGSGEGDKCSSYGNRNFLRYFTAWFGHPANLLRNAGFESSASGWGSGVKTVGLSRKANSAGGAQAGKYFLSTSTKKSGSSLRQSVSRVSKAGDVYSASVWLKSRSATESFTGIVRLTAAGGKSEKASKTFTVGPEWTEYVVTLPIYSSHKKLYLDVFEKTTGVSLGVDSAVLVRGELEQPRTKLRLTSPSFEGSTKGWVTTSASMGLRTGAGDLPASHGKSYLLAKALKAKGAVTQNVTYALAAGRSYTASVMVRTSSEEPLAGSLIVRGVGSNGDPARTDFVATNEWQRVQVTYAETRNGVKGIRFEVRMNAAGAKLHIDDALLSPNLAPNTSFESSALGGWSKGTGTVTASYVVGGDIHPEIADHATVLRAKNATGAPVSLRANIARPLTAGETYTATILLRSADAGATVSGSARLGSGADVTSEPFAVGNEWTLVTTKFVVPTTATTMRYELFIDTAGGTVDVDGLWVR